LRLETANRRILQLAQTDILTSLANRRAFMKRLSMAFNASLRGSPAFAVLYLDIDDFKDVNDTLGHAMGDQLLKEVVERLKSVVREEDLVARFGGDEFAVLACNVNDPTEAGTLAARIGEYRRRGPGAVESQDARTAHARLVHCHCGAYRGGAAARELGLR